jgi:hypothetical protein
MAGDGVGRTRLEAPWLIVRAFGDGGAAEKTGLISEWTARH